MATFVGDKSGLSVYEGQEILRIEAWGDNSAHVRSTLGRCVTETPGNALGEVEDTNASLEILGDRARYAKWRPRG